MNSNARFYRGVSPCISITHLPALEKKNIWSSHAFARPTVLAARSCSLSPSLSNVKTRLPRKKLPDIWAAQISRLYQHSPLPQSKHEGSETAQGAARGTQESRLEIVPLRISAEYSWTLEAREDTMDKVDYRYREGNEKREASLYMWVVARMIMTMGFSQSLVMLQS